MSIRDRRKEIVRVAAALRTEIGENMQAQSKSGNFSYALEQIDKDKNFVPYVSVEREGNPVFRTIGISALHLPSDVLKDVINYYKIDSFLDSVLKDMQTERFEKLSAERKRNLILSLEGLHTESSISAERAMRALDDLLKTYGVHLS